MLIRTAEAQELPGFCPYETVNSEKRRTRSNKKKNPVKENKEFFIILEIF
jgi:hypothetical protein